MEEARQLFYNRKMVPTGSQPRLTPQDTDIINDRCRKDHLASSSFSQKKNISSYNSSFSPPKLHPHYHSTHFDREIEFFRKNENSSSVRLPTITDNTQYQNLYKGQAQQKLVRSKQKESWFIKSEWPENLTSVYQKDFFKKAANNYNSLNKFRVNYNTLKVYDLRSSGKNVSEYRQEFKAYKVKPELKLSIGNRDHLAGKQNFFAKNELSKAHKKSGSEATLVRRWKGNAGVGKTVKGLRIDRTKQ